MTEENKENSLTIDISRIVYAILKHNTSVIIPTETVIGPIPNNTKIQIDLSEDKTNFTFSLGTVEPVETVEEETASQ